MQGQSNLLTELNEKATLLFDEKNKKYKCFLELSNPTPNGPRIRLPLCLRSKTLQRLGKQGRVRSFVVELWPESTRVKVVFCKQKPEPLRLSEVKAIVGRDFGYANTCTYAVAKVTNPLEEKEVQQRSKLDKKGAKKFLSSHVQEEQNIVARLRFEGGRFLALMNKHSEHIDRLSSQIDGIYNKIERLKALLVNSLALEADTLISKETKPSDKLLSRVHEKFFLLLEQVWSLKQKRRVLYEKMGGVRKSWFGFVSNKEVELAIEHGALVVREKLSLEPIEKKSCGYKGRAFNRMLRDGARGLYEAMAWAKLEYWGVKEVGVGAWYTSSTCPRHGVVEKKMRKSQSMFVCELCAEKKHADEQAAEVLANYLLLKKKTSS